MKSVEKLEVDRPKQPVTYHRHAHALVYLSLSEATQMIAEGREPPFRLCPICGCVPTSLIGRVPPLKNG